MPTKGLLLRLCRETSRDLESLIVAYCIKELSGDSLELAAVAFVLLGTLCAPTGVSCRLDCCLLADCTSWG